MESRDIADLHKACRVGDMNFIEKSYESNKSQLNERDKSLGWTPLYRTVICGHAKAARFLLEKGADANIANNLGETPLHQAADNSQYTIAQLLLENHADPNLQQNDGDTPLHHAAFRGDSKMLLILMQNNADWNIANYIFGRSPLHYAVDGSHIESVKLMLEYGSDTMLKDRQNKSPKDLANTEEMQQILNDHLVGVQSGDENIRPSCDNTELDAIYHADSFNEMTPASDLLSYNLSSGDDNGETEMFTMSPNINLIISPSQETFGKPGNSSDSERLKAITESLIGIEPEKEKSAMESVGELTPLYYWLDRMGLQEYYHVLMDAGYDDIDAMIDQMRTPLPIEDSTFRDIGISKPGHVVRVILKLEEDASMSKSINKKSRQMSISQSQDSKFNIFGKFGTLPGNLNFGHNQKPNLKSWLVQLKLDSHYMRFIDSGYDDYEFLLGQMRTNRPITEQTLIEDIGIDKPGHRSRIMSRLQEDLALLEANRPSIDNTVQMELTTKNEACNMCLIM